MSPRPTPLPRQSQADLRTPGTGFQIFLVL